MNKTGGPTIAQEILELERERDRLDDRMDTAANFGRTEEFRILVKQQEAICSKIKELQGQLSTTSASC